MSGPRVRVAAVAAQAPSSPAFRIRVGLLRPELALHGVEVDTYTLFSDAEGDRFYGGPLPTRMSVAIAARRRLERRLATIATDVSVALVQRQVDVLPGLRLERAAAAGRRLVWDVDDAIWFRHRVHAVTLAKGISRKAAWLAREADHVIVANAVLAEHLGNVADAITIVPPTVETRDLPVRRHAAGPELVLGWIGSFSTAPYLASVRDVVARIARELAPTPVRLLVVGGTTGPIAGAAVECVPWALASERDALGRIDVGLVPQPDTPWTRGKSAYKAIQYLAAGIPTVADDVGVVAATLGDGGVVVRDENEWVDALLWLARDPELRQQLGAAGRRHAEREFSVARWAPVVASVLRGDGAEPRTAARGTAGGAASAGARAR